MRPAKNCPSRTATTYLNPDIRVDDDTDNAEIAAIPDPAGDLPMLKYIGTGYFVGQDPGDLPHMWSIGPQLTSRTLSVICSRNT
jgi:hypothetical protein